MQIKTNFWMPGIKYFDDGLAADRRLPANLSPRPTSTILLTVPPLGVVPTTSTLTPSLARWSRLSWPVGVSGVSEMNRSPRSSLGLTVALPKKGWGLVQTSEILSSMILAKDWSYSSPE